MVSPPVIIIEGEVPKSDGALKRGVLQGMLNHRIGILKRISQDTYSAFTNLQTSEQVCNEAVNWLDPIFPQWGPYMQFFDRLIPLLAKKPNLPNKVIIVKEGMDKIKDLLGFFLWKLSII